MVNPLRYFNELRQWAAIAYTDITGTPAIPTGNVVGPASSINTHVPMFADSTGKLLADSGIEIQAVLDTRTTAAATFLGAVNFVQTAGRAAVGDYGAALYKKAGGSTTGGFQSADGQWWALAQTTVTPQTFGDCSVECHVAIQNAIDYIHSLNGGIVFFPQTTYTINTQINLSDFVRLQGASGVTAGATLITASADITVLNCVACGHCIIENLFFYNSNATPTHNVMEVDSTTINMTVRDCTFWGGVAAINISGTDCMFQNVYPVGNTWCIFSHGANWYHRCKIDFAAGTLPGSPTAAFTQSTPVAAAIQENTFVQCDFSGVFTDSILIDDGGTSTAFQTFVACVFSQPIIITNAKGSMFNACEIGSTVSVGANVSIFTGNFGLTGVVVSISGTGKVLAGNFHLS